MGVGPDQANAVHGFLQGAGCGVVAVGECFQADGHENAMDDGDPEAEDFGEAFTHTLREREERLRAQVPSRSF